MTRSRAFNRFNRLNAKRRRRSLLAAIPELRDGSHNSETIDCYSALRTKAFYKDGLLDFLEPKQNN